jgi:hypothetical protein
MAALIAAVRSFLFLYSAEAEVSIAIVAVLEALVKNRGICAFLVGPASQACWLPLVDLVTKQLHTLPDLAHCPLVAVFIRVGSGFADSPEQQRAYVYLTLGMIGNRWENLLGRPDFQQIFQQPSVIVQLQNCLDMFSGVADAMELNNQTLLFEFCSKYFDSMHSCLVLYKVSSIHLNYRNVKILP